MNREINLTTSQTLFKLRGEESFSTNRGNCGFTLLGLVAHGDHVFQSDNQSWVGGLELSLHKFTLPEGQRAFSSTDN